MTVLVAHVNNLDRVVVHLGQNQKILVVQNSIEFAAENDGSQETCSECCIRNKHAFFGQTTSGCSLQPIVDTVQRFLI